MAFVRMMEWMLALRPLVLNRTSMSYKCKLNHLSLLTCLTGQFSVDPLRYPTFCVRVASHKSFVRTMGQLTRS
jgi:hypothetical protein